MTSWILTTLFTLISGSYLFAFYIMRSTQSNYTKIKDELNEMKISDKSVEVMLTNINQKLNSISQTVIKDNK